MSQFSQALDRSQRRLEALLGPPVFTLGAATYPCIPSTLRRGAQLELGGFVAEVALTLSVRREALAAPPAIHARLTHAGQSFRIVAVRTPAAGSHHELDIALLKA